MVERFHRQLKGALKARLRGPQWTEELPVVLLGIRSAWREDADTTPAQLLYEMALRLPSEMVPGTPRVPEPEAHFLRGLQKTMRGLAVPPVRHHFFFRTGGRPKTEGTGAKPLIFPPPWGLYSFRCPAPQH